ncbi:hypothetical protein MC885_016858, partial [Smutsia gigantea]
PSLQPQQPAQKPFIQVLIVTTIQDAAQKARPQPPVNQGQPSLQKADKPVIQQQVAPADKPPKAEMFPVTHLISQGPIPQNKPSPNAPARLGITSSEEMAFMVCDDDVFGKWLCPGKQGGPMAYGAVFPGFGGMRPSLGGMPPNPAMGGDFTLEFDSSIPREGRRSDLGGDRNNVLEQLFESNHLNEGTAGPTPEQLVISTLDDGPDPEEIQSAVQGNEEYEFKIQYGFSRRGTAPSTGPVSSP